MRSGFWRPAASLPGVALILYTFYFFRDPDRPAPADALAVVAPADGLVVEIIEKAENGVVNGAMRRVAIFLSVFDVHTNRAPIAAEVTYCEHYPGKFLDARNPGSSTRTRARPGRSGTAGPRWWCGRSPGAIARRIVGMVQGGGSCGKGERFGMIRFGSRTEVYLPLDSEITVKPGDRVKGGETIVGAAAVKEAGMKEDEPQKIKYDEPRIYLLPNLMTAGNLLCGFVAVLKIVEGALLQNPYPKQAAQRFELAIVLILVACIFDALDGRLARLGGHESAFGREFDSLADIVSFGVAPALMVYKVVLIEFPTLGWIVASLYLLCGALRLARFNCLAAIQSEFGFEGLSRIPNSRRGGPDGVADAFHALDGGERAATWADGNGSCPSC